MSRRYWLFVFFVCFSFPEKVIRLSCNNVTFLNLMYAMAKNNLIFSLGQKNFETMLKKNCLTTKPFPVYNITSFCPEEILGYFTFFFPYLITTYCLCIEETPQMGKCIRRNCLSFPLWSKAFTTVKGRVAFWTCTLKSWT